MGGKTTQEVADVLGVTAGRVRQLAVEYKLGTKRGRDRFFTDEEVAMLQQRQTTPGPARHIHLVASTRDGQHGTLINYHPDHGEMLMFVTDTPIHWGAVPDHGGLTDGQIRAGHTRAANGLTVVWAEHFDAPVNRPMVAAAARDGVRFVRVTELAVDDEGAPTTVADETP